MRPWILPTLATVGFLLLLAHQSESPAVLNRYSIGYAIILILCALHIGLLWRSAVQRLSYRKSIAPPAALLLSLVVLIISTLFLFDFLIGLPSWVVLALLIAFPVWMEPLRKHPFFIANLALLAGSLVLSVILLEWVFASFLLETQTPKSQREFLQLMSSKWPEPISVPKPAGTFRILGLADSFGALGGERNYHYLLEDILCREVSPVIQMVNVSVSAYEPRHELSILRFGMLYSPDLVLHGFFVGNDFTLFGEDMYAYRGIPINSQPDASRHRPRDFWSRRWVGRVLEFYREERRRHREFKLGMVDGEGTLSKGTFFTIQFRKMAAVWGKPSNEGVVRMKKIFPVLDAIRSVIEKSGARYVMVIHPDQTQVDDRLRQDILNTFQVRGQDYDFDLPQKILGSYCAERRIPCLDLLPIFRAQAKIGDLYLVRDTHYNLSGNQLAAASIDRFLHNRQLLPSIASRPGASQCKQRSTNGR